MIDFSNLSMNTSYHLGGIVLVGDVGQILGNGVGNGYVLLAILFNGILRSKTPALTGVFYCFNRLTNPGSGSTSELAD